MKEKPYSKWKRKQLNVWANAQDGIIKSLQKRLTEPKKRVIIKLEGMDKKHIHLITENRFIVSNENLKIIQIDEINGEIKEY